MREIYPAQSVALPPPPFPQKEKSREQQSQPAFIFEIPNVNLWAYYGGAIVTADNALLADLSPEVWGVTQHPILSRWRLPPARLLDGRIAVAVTPEAARNYYHWMLDALPRLLLLKHATGNFANYDAILVNGSRANYEDQSLTALEVPSAKIRYVDSRHRFQISSAVVPSMDHNAKVTAPWKIQVLRSLMVAADRAGARRFYISRRRAGVRRVANEDEIDPILREHRFAILELEDFSWTEQARLFAHADVIIAPHGAGLANTVFCAAGTRIVEISTRAGYRNWYLQLAAAGQLRYNCIEARPLNASLKSYRACENDDMLVSRAAIEQLVRSL